MIGLPTPKQIARLNQNALVSLHNDLVTEERFKLISANPDTTFLAPTNATVEQINKYVVNVLFANERPLCYVVNGFQSPMAMYKNMTVIITENSYYFLNIDV